MRSSMRCSMPTGRWYNAGILVALPPMLTRQRQALEHFHAITHAYAMFRAYRAAADLSYAQGGWRCQGVRALAWVRRGARWLGLGGLIIIGCYAFQPTLRHAAPPDPLANSLEVWHNQFLRARMSRLARLMKPYAPSKAPRLGPRTGYGSMGDHTCISKRGALLDGTFGLAPLSRYNYHH